MIGKYNGYGSIELSKDSISLCDNFRNKVNSSLMNNPDYRKKVEQSRFSFAPKYYLFKRSDYNEVDYMYFSTDKDLIERSNDESSFYETKEIKDNDFFLSLLSNGSLVSIDSRSVTRFSFQLIRKDIYDSMVSKVYKSKKSRVKKKIQEAFETKMDDDSFCDFGQDHLGSEIIELFNSDNHLVNEVLRELNYYIKTNGKESKPSNVVNYKKGMLDWSLICGMYANLGKSFYPNVSKHQDMSDILVLNEIINQKAKEGELENE